MFSGAMAESKQDVIDLKIEIFSNFGFRASM
jgi:hypothetical protein